MEDSSKNKNVKKLPPLQKVEEKKKKPVKKDNDDTKNYCQLYVMKKF